MGMHLALTLQLYGSTGAIVPNAFNYSAPTISGFNMSSTFVEEGATVTLMGSSFGNADLTPQARLGNTACEATVWVSSAAVLCTAPSGIAGAATLVLTTSRALSTLENALSYTPPSIDAPTGAIASGPALGGAVVTVFGVGFGNQDHKMLDLTVGFTGCNPTAWVSDSSMACVAAPGVGGNLPVTLHVPGFAFNMSSTFAYHLPTIERVEPMAGSSAGGQVVTVFGTNFGPSAEGQTVRIGGRGCLQSTWVSDSVMLCSSPAGALTSVSVGVSVGGQAASLAGMFSYSSPSCRAVLDADPASRDGYYLLDPEGDGDYRRVWCNILSHRAGVEGRLGVYSGDPWLWLDASTASDLVTSGPSGGLHGTPTFVDAWHSRVGDISLLPEGPLSDGMRPVFTADGVVHFDGVDDVLVATHRRPASPNVTTIVALRPDTSLAANGRCPAGGPAILNTWGERVCEPGWPLSDNDLSSPMSPRGFGIHIDADGLLQAAVGSRTGLYASSHVGQEAHNLHVVTMEQTSSFVRLWIDGVMNLDYFDSLASLDGLAGVVNMTLGARGTHGTGQAHILQQDHFSGDVAEVLVFDRLLSEGERVRAERSLLARWLAHASPPADGGRFRVVTPGTVLVPTPLIVQEAQEVLVEVERSGGSDGYANLVFRVRDLTAVHGVDFLVSLNGSGVFAPEGHLVWDHGDVANKVLLIRPIHDHMWKPAATTFEIELSVFDGEHMVHLSRGTHPTEPRYKVQLFNHDPGILRISRGNAPTLGGVAVTLLGEGFLNNDLSILGNTAKSYAISVGATACSSTQWLAETAIRCVVPPGTGSAHAISLTVNGNWSSNATFTFDAPVMDSLLLYSGTSGGGHGMLGGRNFGTVDVGAEVLLGDTACQPTLWVSASSMSCVAAPGVGGNLPVSMVLHRNTSQEQSGVAPTRFSYRRPVVSSTSLRAQTGTLPIITVRGANFGLQDYMPTARVGVTACKATAWTSDTEFACVVPPGTGDQPVSISVENGASNPAVAPRFRYLDPPVTVAIAAVPWQDGVVNRSITITGRNYGTTPTQVSVAIGGTQALSSAWVSSTAVVATISPGAGESKDVRLAVYAQSASGQTSFTYRAPTVTTALPAEASPDGNTTLTLSGYGFGMADYSPVTSVGMTSCKSTVWTSDSALQCVTAAGTGVVDIRVQVDNQQGPGTEYAYLGPRELSLVPGTRRTAGGDVLTIEGLGFGPAAPSSLAAFVGATACTSTTWVSPTVIECVVPAGTGVALDVQLHLISYRRTMAASLSYDGPTITSLDPAFAATGGAASLVLFGSNFGSACAGCAISVHVGASECASVQWTSATKVACLLLPGVGAGLTVMASVDGSSNAAAQSFSYNAPRVTSLTPASVSEHGGPLVTVNGYNFGMAAPPSDELALSFGSGSCTQITWTSDSEVLCRTGTGSGQARPVAATVARSSKGPGQHPVDFSYWPAPVVDATVPTQISPLGGITLTIRGASFDTRGSGEVVSVAISGIDCPLLGNPRTATDLVCVTPVLSSAPYDLVVSVGNRDSLAFDVDEDPPTVTAVRAVAAALGAGAHVTVFGRNFGGSAPMAGSLQAAVGSDACTPVDWVSDSSIACALAATIRSSMPAIAVRLASLESAPFAFTMTDVTGDLPRHAVGLRNKGATVELISYDAVAATADLLAVFPIGPIDYGLSAVDAATQHMFVVNYDEANRANITTLGITPSTRAILATHAIRLEGTLPSGNLPAMEHAVVVNLEFDKGSKRLVAALAGRGCSDTWIVSLDPTSGIAVPLGAFNGSVSTHLTAIDPFSKTYFVVLEAAQQQLVSFSIDESHGLSPCEQAGGKCQAMQDSRECIYDAPILTEASNAAAEAVCAGLNVSCDFVEWSQQAGGFVMFRRNVPGETCKQPRVLYGPVLGDVRAMTLDMQTRQLMVVREDSSGELRQIADENFQVLQLDIAPITSSIPNIYRRVVSRRLLAHLGFWATPPTDTAFSRFVPETRVVSSFTATRVLPGIVSILYRRKLVIVQQDLDTVSVHPYDDSAHAMSGATSRQAGLRSLFNVEDLEDLLLPRVVYVAPGHASALGGTTLTILGHNFGISDPSPVVRIDGIACAASVWVSDAEIVCHGAAAKPSGTLLGIVGGQIELVGVPTAVLVPNMTKYVAQRDASHTSELCHTCHAPQEVWTWESSGTTVVSRFVQRVLGDTSVSTCGVGGSQCSAVLESGNRLLVAAMSFSPDGALTFTLADYENGDATFLLSVAYGAAVTQTRFRIVTEAVNNLPSATVANAGVVEACVGTPASSARAFYAVNVSAGGLVGNEAHQAVTVTVTPLAGDTLLASGTIPLIYPGSGLLTFELAEWAYGAQTFRIDVHDDGGLGTALPYTPASCGDASLAQDAVSCHWNSSRATNLTIRVPRSNTPPVFLFTSSMHVSPPGPGVSVVVQDGTGSHNVSAVVRVLEGTAAFRIDHFLEEMHAGSGIFQALEDGEQTLTFSLAFVGGQADLLLEPPTVFPNGSLSVHPVQHVAGAGGRVIFDLTVRDDGGVECGAVDTVTKRFAVDINYVNYPPSFSLNLMTVTRDENECSEERPCVVPGFATNMTAGPLEEWQNVSMVATVVGWEVLLCDGYALLPEDALFPLTNPSVTAAGALVFVSQPFCSGSVNVSIEMVDSGGTAHGGQNHSAAEMVTLVIASVDQPPRFTLPADAVFVTSADAGARAYPAFARNISAGAPRGRDILQSLSFSVSVLSAPDAFFLSPPAVDAGGRLTFAASGHVGVALCDLLLTDSGGLESPRSTPASRFNITVLNLNDPPQFALSQASIHVSEDEEGFGLEEIVVNITVGAEELQTLAFNVVQVGGALGLFSVPPHLECTAGNPGACTAASVALETAEDRFGHAVFALTLVDDGGRECLAPGRCGEDTSRSVNFTVTIAPENDKPSFALAAPDLLINANTWCIESNPPPYACGATIPGVAIPNNFRH
ncbi:hypothetical protein T484DRAFT_1960071, partial [Baffinella frigidus]